MASNPQQERAAPAGDEPPPLTYKIAASDDHRREGLTLVADSIAQQRQTASLAVITHPLCIAGLFVAYAAAYQRNASDWGTIITILSGLTIAYLAAVRLFTGQYITIAERFQWKTFIAAPSGEDDVVVTARFGEELIAALVLRLERPAAQPEGEGHSKNKNKNKNKNQTEAADAPKQGGGFIRAWTTKLRFRNKGVGADMLRFAVMTAREACGPDATITFDPEHANHALPLHSMFNRPFATRDRKAADALAHAIRDCDSGSAGFKA